MPADRAALFILNPASGSDDADETERAVVERLEQGGLTVEVRRTEGEGDAREWAREAASAGEVALVAVAGGDGSVREAVSGLVAGGGGVPICIVPTGTANLLARALGVPIGEPAEAAAVGVDGEGRTIDVMQIGEDGDDHAVIMVDAGFDADLVRDADRGNKDTLGPLAYVVAGIRNLFDLDEVELELELDGEVQQITAHTVFCLNVGRIGETVVVSHDIEPDDGVLHVGIVGQAGAAQAAKTAFQMVAGEQEEHDNVTWHSCTRVRVTSTPPLKVQVDGDPTGETPFVLELLPGAVTIQVPTDADR